MSKDRIQLHTNIYLEWKDDNQTKGIIHCYEIANSFKHYECGYAYSTLSIKKETPNSRGKGYYYIYKRIAGKLHKLYLGNIPEKEAIATALERLRNLGLKSKIFEGLPNELPNTELIGNVPISNDRKTFLKKQFNQLPNRLPNNDKADKQLPNELPNKFPSKDKAIEKAKELYKSKPKKSDKSARESLSELIEFIYQSEANINFKD